MMGRCFACGGEFENRIGPTHKYMLSSPGCWAAYGELLAREYQNPVLFGAVHRLTVDAYALQHPGDPLDRRARQSVWVHYIALYLAFRMGKEHAAIPPVMQRLAGGVFPELPSAPKRFSVTLSDVAAQGEKNHVSAVTAWAKDAFEAWSALESEAISLIRLA